MRNKRILTSRGSLVEKVNIREKLRHIREYWKPCIVAELNGQQVKLDKLKGKFIWHHHENEDEMFLVLKGKFRLEFRDRHSPRLPACGPLRLRRSEASEARLRRRLGGAGSPRLRRVGAGRNDPFGTP